jgi:integrase
MTTGQRPSEVLGIRDTEVSRAWWAIPAERTKARRAHTVYLAPQARWLLKTAFRRYGRDPFKGVKHQVLAKAVSRLGLGFTPHDLRRTMSTRLADLGVQPYIIEKMLNHQMEGVWAVYNRAEYLPERREAWRLWGRTLANLRRRARREDRSQPGNDRPDSDSVRGGPAEAVQRTERPDSVRDGV